MIVEIKPIERERWHGLAADKSFAQPVRFTTQVDTDRMEYALDIDTEELEALAKKTGWNLSLQYVPGEMHPFWESNMMKIVLPHETVLYDLSNPIERLKYAACRRSPFVAISEKEIGNKPYCTHYIYSEEEQVSEQMTKVAKKNNARKLSMAMPQDKKAFLIRLLKGKDVQSRSVDVMDVYMDELIEKNADEVIKYATLPDERIYSLAIIDASLRGGFLQKEGTSIYYGSDRIGFDTEEAANYLEQPLNSQMRIRLKELCKL